MPSAVARAVLQSQMSEWEYSDVFKRGETHRVPSLEDDKKPASDVGGNRHPLCVDTAEPKLEIGRAHV